MLDYTACYCKLGVYSKKLYHRETEPKGFECMIMLKKKQLRDTEGLDRYWGTQHEICKHCMMCSVAKNGG